MVILGLLLTVYFGYSILLLTGSKSINVFARITMSYLLGIGLQTLIMFYMAFSNIKLDVQNVSVYMILTTLVINLIYFILHKSVAFKLFINDISQTFLYLKRYFFKSTVFEKILIISIFVISAFVLMGGIYWPVAGWDSIALYDFRAKVFSQTGYMWDAIERGYFFGYPLMTSMMNTWIYLLGNNYPRVMYSLVFISLTVLFYSSLRKSLPKLNSLVFTLLLIISPSLLGHSFFDYTNMPYTTYFFVSTVYMYFFTKEKKYSYLITSAIMMGIATWIRSTDPFWVVNIIVLLIWCVFNRQIKPLFYYLVFFLPIQQSWNFFLTKMTQIVSTQSIVQSSISILFSNLETVRLISVFTFVVGVVGPMLYKYLILVVLALIVGFKSLNKYIYITLLTFGNFGLLFVGSYVFSFMWPGWDLIGESLGRMSFVFIPIFLYYSAILYDKKIF